MWKSCLLAPHSFDRHLGVCNLQPLLLISLIVQITNKVPFDILQPGSKQPWLMTLISEKIRSKISINQGCFTTLSQSQCIIPVGCCALSRLGRGPCPDMVLPWRWCVTSPLGCNGIENLGLDEQWTAQHNSQRHAEEFEIETFWNHSSNSLHFRRTPNYGCFSSKFWNCINSFSRTNAEFCGGTEIYQQHARFGLDWQQQHSDTLLNKKTNKWQGWWLIAAYTSKTITDFIENKSSESAHFDVFIPSDNLIWQLKTLNIREIKPKKHELLIVSHSFPWFPRFFRSATVSETVSHTWAEVLASPAAGEGLRHRRIWGLIWSIQNGTHHENLKPQNLVIFFKRWKVLRKKSRPKPCFRCLLRLQSLNHGCWRYSKRKWWEKHGKTIKITLE